MRERTSIRVDLLDEVEAFAAAHGLDFDTAFARLLARGLIRKLESELAPLLDPISDAQRPGELTPGRASDPATDAVSSVPLPAQPGSDGAGAAR